MSGECDRCSEHTLECICDQKNDNDFEIFLRNLIEFSEKYWRMKMDKLINKVKKDEEKAKSALKKGLKDTKTLLKADKKFDKKIDKAEKVLKKKK